MFAIVVFWGEVSGDECPAAIIAILDWPCAIMPQNDECGRYKFPGLFSTLLSVIRARQSASAWHLGVVIDEMLVVNIAPQWRYTIRYDTIKLYWRASKSWPASRLTLYLTKPKLEKIWMRVIAASLSAEVRRLKRRPTWVGGSQPTPHNL